jgi:hypothetical protein
MIKIAFSDYYENFDPSSCRIFTSLAAHEEVKVCSAADKPDVLVYGDFGEEHWKFTGLKVYLTGENMSPDFNECDLAFTPFEIPGDPRAVRLPYFAQALGNPNALLRRGSSAAGSAMAAGFCSFVVSNPRSWPRNRFFKKMNRRRRVDSGGSLFNNLRGKVTDKSKFISQYRFNIAFENTETNGYITEKLTDPLLAGTIPIYWGAPDVLREFNPDCFIHARDFPNLDTLVDFVIDLDADPVRQLKYRMAPVFHGDLLPPCLTDSYLAEPLMRLIKVGKPTPRLYRHRRLRENVYAGRNWLTNKWERLGCKLEAQAWKLGWRI